MKKILFLMICLFAIPTCILAANPSVKTLEMTNDSGTIKYNGTTEDGVYAVMCKLYNSKEEEIDLLSSSVENSKFEGSFTVSTSDNYKVACANYEGGEFKTVEVSVGKDDINTSNPKTYDNIGYYIAILGICVISGIVLMNKKKIC